MEHGPNHSPRTPSGPAVEDRPAYMRPPRWGAALAATLLALAAVTAGSAVEIALGKGAPQPLHLASQSADGN